MRGVFRVEHGKSIMVLGCKDEVLCPRICDEVDPGFCVPVLCSEVGEEIVIDNIRPICVELMIIDIGFVGVSMMSIPPIPLSIDFYGSRVSLKNIRL